MLGCSNASPAKKRYERDVLCLMTGYLVIIFVVSRILKHGHIQGLRAYFFSFLPAIIIVGLLARMGSYLREETDEYERMLTVRSILIGTAALLGTLVVNDFVRAFAGAGALPPFACFLVFMVTMGIAQLVNWAQNRGREE